MVLGQSETLPSRAERDLRAAGLSHLLAVSGLHVGMVATMLYLLGRLGGLGRRASPCLAALGVLLYAGLVGGRPPVLRAVGMLSAGLAGAALGRRAGSGSALAWAAAAIALILPEEVHRPGYQLSFVACAALIRGGRAGGPWWRRLVGASLAAQLGSLPLVLFHFGRVAPFALLANLAGLPLASLVVGGSLGAALLEPLFPQAGAATAGLARAAAGLLLAVAEIVGELPGSGRTLAPVGPLWCLLASLALLAALGSRGARRFLLGTAGLLLFLAGPLRPAGAPPPAGALELVALDVGQGSALLVTTGAGRSLLVDGGGSPGSDYPVGERRLLPQLRDLGVGHLELVALTHPDADHGEGLLAVLEAMPVGRLVLPGEDCDHPLARRLAAAAARRGVPTEGWWAGRREAWEGLTLMALGPGRGSVCGANDESLVLRLEGPGGVLLLPGDVEGAGERALLESGARLEARVLVVPHHGSAGSSSPFFLDRVRPELALIQAGERNPFGHPHARVLEALRRRRIRVLRTDRDGALRVLLYADGRLRAEPLTRRSGGGWP
jgi:competence protein ComEC